MEQERKKRKEAMNRIRIEVLQSLQKTKDPPKYEFPPTYQEAVKSGQNCSKLAK